MRVQKGKYYHKNDSRSSVVFYVLDLKPVGDAGCWVELLWFCKYSMMFLTSETTEIVYGQIRNLSEFEYKEVA